MLYYKEEAVVLQAQRFVEWGLVDELECLLLGLKVDGLHYSDHEHKGNEDDADQETGPRGVVVTPLECEVDSLAEHVERVPEVLFGDALVQIGHHNLAAVSSGYGVV